jgi:hypothetical protein
MMATNPTPPALDLQPFRELLASDRYATDTQRALPAAAADFIQLLPLHGELQLNMASGKVYSVHLGDVGYLDGQCLRVRLGTGTVVNLHWSQVENVWFHLASED